MSEAIRIEALAQALASQRNAGLDALAKALGDLAVAQARIQQLEAEVEELKRTKPPTDPT